MPWKSNNVACVCAVDVWHIVIMKFVVNFGYRLRFRVLWTIVHLIGTTSLVLILKWTWENHTANPLVTTLYDTNYPVGNIPFPAVAVCNNNLLSLQRARKFAEEL